MRRAWCDQIRFNKKRDCIPKGFRLLYPHYGIIEWNGVWWQATKADEVAVLSTGKVYPN